MFARIQRVASSRSHSLPAFVETLETRRLLSAGPSVPAPPTAVLVGGELRVTGTKGDDVILVSLDASDATKVDVNVNGSLLGSFALSDITSGNVDVRAGKGDDTVRVDETNGLFPLHLVAYGEQGNDTLVGGSADDELHGGQGDDVLYGNDGNDDLFGDEGNDMLAGGFGDDSLVGGNGTYTFSGETGAYTMFGVNGMDVVDGGDGDDVIDGGRGSDALTGDAGADTFAGTERAKEVLDNTVGEDLYTPIAHPAVDHHGGSGK
jgi:Ca2+-binding RTX toxin-like protein